MERRDSYTKTVAIIGTVFVWYPILRTLYVTIYFLVSQGKVVFPYFLPYQFFPATILGGGLLLWAALGARAQRKIIAWAFGIALLTVGGIIVVQIGGLSNTYSGWMILAGLIDMGIFSLANVLLVIGSILLLRDLFRFRTCQ